MLLKIVWKNIISKKLTSILSVLLMMLGIGIISLVLTLGKQLEEKFSKNVAGIDMVVGAKGSPLQLILSGVYHIDAPTGNIPLKEVDNLRTNSFVMEVIPLSMGDNYMGTRIVGTSQRYLKHFNAVLQLGKTFENDLEVVVGQNVARELNLKIGDKFESTHGYDKEAEEHHEKKYVVKGILKYNNSVIDNLIICNLSSIWAMHEENSHEAESEHEKEVTCALVKFRNPLGLITVPRLINQNTVMQAALPAIEINRLFKLMGIGVDALKYLAFAIIIISGISVFITLYNALKERKYELALMLSMGGKRFTLFMMLLLEGIVLSLAGWISGILISKLGIFLASGLLFKSYHYTFEQNLLQKEEIYLLVAALIVGIFASLIPAVGIYKINITKTLAKD